MLLDGIAVTQSATAATTIKCGGSTILIATFWSSGLQNVTACHFLRRARVRR
jgi:hypothetical protein